MENLINYQIFMIQFFINKNYKISNYNFNFLQNRYVIKNIDEKIIIKAFILENN